MTELAERISGFLGLPATVVENTLFSIGVIVLLLLVRFLYVRLILNRMTAVERFYRWRRVGTHVLTGTGSVLIVLIWLRLGAGAIAQFIALVGAGLAIAMHETVSNLTGWAFITWRKPFDVGDRIEIDSTVGDVIDIRLFQFSVIEVGSHRIGGEQSTGRILHIPNGKVLREKVANFETGFRYIWDEIPILVTFESDWRTAKEILVEIVNRHVENFSQDAEAEIRQAARRFMIFTGKLTPIVYTSIQDSGVLLTMRFILRPRTRRGIHEKICEDILTEFAKHDDIDFAYPTMRYYQNFREGKPGTIPQAPPNDTEGQDWP